MKSYRISNDCVALIPARGGSKGVPGKNIRRLRGFPLLAYSIAAAALSSEIDRIIVSTDSPQIAEAAKAFGAEAPFLRPEELAQDTSDDLGFVRHAIWWLGEHEDKVPAWLTHLRPTTPLRDTVIIDDAIRTLKNSKEATSLRSGHVASESPYKWFLRNREGYFESISGGLSNDMANSARQGFPEVYIPDGYVDVLKTEFIINSSCLHGDKIIGYISPCCQEIDTMDDFALAEYFIQKTDNSLYQYLKKEYGHLQSEEEQKDE